MDEAKDTAVICRCVSAHAASLGVAIAPEELAELAVRHDMGTSEIAALDAVFAYLADKRHDQVIETLLRLPRPSPASTSTAYAGGTRRRCASCRRSRTSTHARTWRS